MQNTHTCPKNWELQYETTALNLEYLPSTGQRRTGECGIGGSGAAYVFQCKRIFLAVTGCRGDPEDSSNSSSGSLAFGWPFQLCKFILTMKTTQRSLKICSSTWGSLLSSGKWIHWNGGTEQHFCLTGNQTHGLRQMSQTALNAFLNNYQCCTRTAARRERHLPFLTESVTHRRRMLWVVLSEETGANPAPCSFWQKARGRGSWSPHVLSVHNQWRGFRSVSNRPFVELEKPDLGYLCSVCVAGSDGTEQTEPEEW